MIRSFSSNTPSIAESAFISEAAYIVCDVQIGENSSVWSCTVIRGKSGCIKHCSESYRLVKKSSVTARMPVQNAIMVIGEVFPVLASVA
jgi:carbonic anhydrase/acetyltransferase-like protein (isoleucine patch superfamily)